MIKKTLVAALPIPGIWNAVETVSLLARALRSADRAMNSSNLVQLPIVDGGDGTIDFLVTNSLGSFLEVEAHGPENEDIVVPIGFAGEDGKIAAIEVKRIAGVPNSGDKGTTVGIGELIQDALDEGAFSIIFGLEEPIAYDAGLGAASALGVRFYDAKDQTIDFSKPGQDPSWVERIDASGRSFALLSSRIFIARSSSVTLVDHPELAHLAEIVHRDTGILPSIKGLSPSAVEFGLSAFLGAEIKEGSMLILEACGIAQAIEKKEFSDLIFLIPSSDTYNSEAVQEVLKLAAKHIQNRVLIVAGNKDSSHAEGERRFYLQDVPLFQAPLSERSSLEEKRRDFSMRLEKLIPSILESTQK